MPIPKKHGINRLFYVSMLCAGLFANAQIYKHDFGTTTISSHPYVVAPAVLDAHLSASSWTNSTGSWTSTTGATGQAIRLTTNANATISLHFSVAPNFAAAITSFSFWSQRSTGGPQNWAISVNGTPIGSGTIGTTASDTGTLAVATPISGLTGNVQIDIALTGSSGNGTFRLDDFTLNGSVVSNCSGATVASIFPASGPQNTLVAISGSGFNTGSGTSQVLFNGIASSFTVLSDSEIKAYVPAGNATGSISVVTNACESFAPIAFAELTSSAVQNYSSDIYISELYDAQAGDGGVIELYNGTAAAVNLSGYSIKRYGDIGGSTFYTINLSGTIAAGAVFLIGIGTGTIPCGITGDQLYSTGFNGNDDFQLWKNGVWIDDVHAPNNVGYSVMRKPDAIAPTPVFNANDWTTNTTESCADIGHHNVLQNVAPTVSAPSSASGCENGSASFSVAIAQAGFSYQWMKLDNAGNWINVPNTAPFSGTQTATLTISPLPASFDASQFYCQLVSSAATVYSNAAQLELTPAVIPDFPTSLTICSGDAAPPLNSTSPNGISGTWNPPAIDNLHSGSYVFTPNAGQCASAVTLAVTVNNSVVPDFPTSLTICSGDAVPALNSVSPNGISGTWNPPAIDNLHSGSYVFTPNAGQCASAVTLAVTVNNSVVPDFPTSLTICSGDAAPPLNSVSPNGISGTWNPSAIDNLNSASYVFTPNAGQCASAVTLSVTVNSSVVPDFPTSLTICSGDALPPLNPVSPNGVSGTWNPPAIDNLHSNSYVFTPNAGQCASALTLIVTVNSAAVPNFATALTICSGDAVPALNSTSPNGISGTWNPPAIDNLHSSSYVFTPNAGQCASSVTLMVTVNPLPDPVLADASICEDTAASVLLDTGLPSSGYSFTWTLDGNALSTTSATHLATAAGHYSVSVVNVSTGCAASAQANVVSLSGIVATVASPRDFESDGNATVHVTGGSGHYSFLLDGQTLQNDGHFYGLPSGEHTVEVRDLEGCGVQSVTFFLLDYPKYFTPNADGFHDLWNISGLPNLNARLYIFDRYGKLLKQMDPTVSSGWDGTFNGRELPSTDYWFKLDYVDRNGADKEFAAHFSLKR